MSANCLSAFLALLQHLVMLFFIINFSQWTCELCRKYINGAFHIDSIGFSKREVLKRTMHQTQRPLILNEVLHYKPISEHSRLNREVCRTKSILVVFAPPFKHCRYSKHKNMMKIVLIFKSFLLYQGTQRIWSLLGQNDNLSQQKTREA